MRVTWRLVALLAAGAALFVLTAVSQIFAIIGLVFDAIVASLVITDMLLTGTPETTWKVRRVVEPRLSLGAQNKVQVAVQYIGRRSSRPRFVLVRDEPPITFDVEGSASQRLQMDKNSDEREIGYAYAVNPPAKGDFEFGNISVQYDGVLGLIARAYPFSAGEPVKVYPNLRETEKFELLARRGLLQQLGIKNSRLRGAGSEFESLREYVPGDEYRRIDWSATARRNKLISRQYEVEKSQNVIIAIDTGRTMLQPIGKMTKLDYVVNTALVLAYFAARSDDKVGLMVFDAETRAYMPPAKSRGQVSRITNELYNVNARMTESDYAAAFSDVATRWRRRSLFVLFTDLIDPDSSAGVLNAMSLLERQYKTIVVTISDPNLVHSAQLVPETEAEVYQKSVAMQALHDRRAAISVLKRKGIWTVDSPPAMLSADLINSYMEVKARAAI